MTDTTPEPAKTYTTDDLSDLLPEWGKVIRWDRLEACLLDLARMHVETSITFSVPEKPSWGRLTVSWALQEHVDEPDEDDVWDDEPDEDL